jgi:hypothetical protein
MEKRSRRRTRDLVTQAASQGLSENEIGCARISMMARSTNAPRKGRIQMSKTNPLRLPKFGLQRTAGPYRWVMCGRRPRVKGFFGSQLAVGCKSCVRPVGAALMTAGPDVIRRSSPYQSPALMSA